MLHRCSRRHALLQLIRGSASTTALVAAASGCGSILYPERIGQRGGPIDWKVAALDTAGLLLFFVPGVIAFAVDFYNGTIFLPRGHYSGYRPGARPKLETVEIPRGSLNRAGIEQIVSRHLGQPVELDSRRCHAEPLENLERFWPRAQKLKEGARA